uniref:Uncharacterized protein n=1 Tax=Plectus sambesii TaxID=2011161 RepID=A0A914UUK9_9BILA
MRPTTLWKATCADWRACLSVKVVRRFTVAVDFDIDYTWSRWVAARGRVAVGASAKLARARLVGEVIQVQQLAGVKRAEDARGRDGGYCRVRRTSQPSVGQPTVEVEYSRFVRSSNTTATIPHRGAHFILSDPPTSTHVCSSISEKRFGQCQTTRASLQSSPRRAAYS